MLNALRRGHFRHGAVCVRTRNVDSLAGPGQGGGRFRHEEDTTEHHMLGSQPLNLARQFQGISLHVHVADDGVRLVVVPQNGKLGAIRGFHGGNAIGKTGHDRNALFR